MTIRMEHELCDNTVYCVLVRVNFAGDFFSENRKVNRIQVLSVVSRD